VHGRNSRSQILEVDYPPSLHVVRDTGPMRPKLCHAIDCVAPDNVVGVHNNQIDTLLHGVLERIFFVKRDGAFGPPPKPLPGVVVSRLSEQWKAITISVGSSTRIDAHEFAMMYTGRRRIMNLNAADSLLIYPITLKDAMILVFVKADKTNWTLKPGAVPRIISPSNRRYLVETGRSIKPLEHKLVKAVDEMFGEPTIMKGYNANDCGKHVFDKWSKFRNPVAIGLDASRFDQHVNRDILQWEHSIYCQADSDPQLAWLLKMQLNPKCTGRTSDGFLRYTVEGTRTSGCINTGIGNCLIMSSMVHAYMVHKELNFYSLLNNGDDCVVIIEKSDLNKFSDGLSEWFLEMGFTMVVEDPVYEIEEIVFCQTQPVWVDGGYRMVRQVPNSFLKDSLSIKPLNSASMTKKWMDAVGQGGMSLSSGLPVLQQFYTYYLRAANSINLKRTKSRRVMQRRKRSKLYLDPVMETGFARMGLGMDPKFMRVSDRTRVSFWKAFGIDPETQVCLEKHYDQLQFEFEVVLVDGPVTPVFLF